MSSIQKIDLERRGIRVNDDDLKPRSYFTAKKSDATLQRERLDARYQARSNVCPDCRQTRSLAGSCDCN